MEVVDVFAHRGRFFRVLQQTARSQTAVMTIDPGADAGPEEHHDGDQIIYVVEGEAIVGIEDREHKAGSGAQPRSEPAVLRHGVCPARLLRIRRVPTDRLVRGALPGIR